MTNKTRIGKSGLWVACVLASMAPLAMAAEKYSDVKYLPPDGFAGYQWGQLRLAFERLPSEPLGVGAGWIHPQEKSVGFTCRPMPYMGPRMDNTIAACAYDATLNTMHRTTQGGGFYVLSEYAIDGQGFQLGKGEESVVLYPVVYQFCANWRHSNKRVMPKDFGFRDKFCGVRLEFQSESREELAKLPAEHVTVYDRALEQLLVKFGYPDQFRRQGKVIIESPDGTTAATDRQYSIWRWCPPSKANAFRIDCPASVTLTIDPVSGRGTILYSTPSLWEYAYARHNNGHKGEWLYATLHALEEKRAR